MHEQNVRRFAEYMRTQGFDAALLSSPFTVTWLTGYAPGVQTGPSPFEGGPALAWWRNGELTLVISDTEAPGAQETGVQVRDYLSYTIDEPLLGTARQADALRALLSEQGAMTGRVVVDLNFMPAAIVPALYAALPHATIVPIDGAFDALRAVKAPEELGKIRQALRLADLAQFDVRDHLVPGVSELELWGGMKARLEVEAGTRVPVLTDLVGGLRTAEIGGLPGSYAVQPGDAVIFDMVPRIAGYWGDNAATYFVGDAPAALAKAYRVVRDTLRRGVGAVRPGLKANALDAMLRDAIRAAGYEPHPHHSGHGVGASFHEEPRIVPYNEMALEAGMVVALEPGIYLPEVGGIRLEDMVLVTADGCELLTTHLLDR
ncbi:MAG: M24 family metallopeptidase [Anaerolineae bacterium]